MPRIPREPCWISIAAKIVSRWEGNLTRDSVLWLINSASWENFPIKTHQNKTAINYSLTKQCLQSPIVYQKVTEDIFGNKCKVDILRYLLSANESIYYLCKLRPSIWIQNLDIKKINKIKISHQQITARVTYKLSAKGHQIINWIFCY